MLGKALIYECSRISLGIILAFFLFIVVLTVVFGFDSNSLSYLALSYPGSIGYEFLLIVWTLSQIRHLLVTPSNL